MEQRILNLIRDRGLLSRDDLIKSLPVPAGMMGDLIEAGKVTEVIRDGNVYYHLA